MAFLAMQAAVSVAFMPALHSAAPLRAPAVQPTMLADPFANLRTAMPATLLSVLLVMAPISEANAARAGGRVGGRAPSVSRSAPSRSPSTTNVYTAPPARTTNVYVGGGGYGGYGYGGYGYGGGISTGTYLGISLVETLIREQQRQAFLQQQLRTQQELGRDSAMIQQLQSQLAEQNAKVEGLRTQQASGGAPPAAAAAAPTDPAAMQMLQQQLLEQQREIAALKAGK